MSEELRKPRIHPRRIIERPRLIQELESSSARIVMLTGRPGYGKTVLAEQWLAHTGSSSGWLRARPSAADVSVVAHHLVAAADSVVPGAGRRLLERLAVTEDPEREAVLLAEMLAEDLRDWPESGWLVIDDYDHIATSTASESFVLAVAAQSSARLVITARSRPTWAHAGNVDSSITLEVRENDLAMSRDEVKEALQRPVEVLVGGWPAVVGLASMLPHLPRPELRTAGAMYEFYAQAVREFLPPDLRRHLPTLARLPRLERGLVELLLGSKAHAVCTQAVELGVLDEREDLLEMHSLFRSFLLRHSVETIADSATVALALSFYRERRDWDSGFELVQRYGLDEELARLILDAVDELLFRGRLSTLEAWVKFARARGVPTHPVFEIAEIETHLRHGQHATALTKSRALLEGSTAVSDVGRRLYMVAGRAAHSGMLEEEALGYYRNARRLSRSKAQDRAARWGEVMCLSVLERPEAKDQLDELVSSVVESNAEDQVRMADRQLSVGIRFGSVRHLATSRRVLELVDQVDDPFTRCSFLGMHAWALALGAYYKEAFAVTERLLLDANELRVDPVLPYAYSTRAIVLAGLGQQREALDAVDAADDAARQINDENGVQNAYSTRIRVLLQAGATIEACAVEPPDVSLAIPSTGGEVIGSRALALATIGRVDEALELAELAGARSIGIECQALCAAVEAVCALKQRSNDVVERAERLIEHVFENGSVDFAITAYRANPDLLTTLLASRRMRDEIVYLIRRAGDSARLEALGLSTTSAVDPTATLSGREQEVYELICEGLSNAEIARRLFITEATVKAHVHHVFDKTGIRSRSALALNAARKRYATSAAGNSASEAEDGASVAPNPEPRAER